MNSCSVRFAVFGVGLALVFGLVGQVQASVQIISAPSSVVEGAWEDDVLIWGFWESSSNIETQVDFITNGTQKTIKLTTDLSPDTVSGTFDSWLLHFDPLGHASPLMKTSGTVVFDKRILGVIVLTNSLDASDGLGAPGTTYPAGSMRGLEWGGQDQITVSVNNDDRNLSVDFFNAGEAVDQVRILTETGASIIPEPTSLIIWLLLGSLGMTVGCWRRRRNAG